MEKLWSRVPIRKWGEGDAVYLAPPFSHFCSVSGQTYHDIIRDVPPRSLVMDED